MELSKEEQEAMFYLKDLENDKENLVIEQRQAVHIVLELISKLQKENEKQGKVIDEMAKEILRIDTAKSKFEYDHAKVWDTENGIKNIFIEWWNGNEL